MLKRPLLQSSINRLQMLRMRKRVQPGRGDAENASSVSIDGEWAAATATRFFGDRKG